MSRRNNDICHLVMSTCLRDFFDISLKYFELSFLHECNCIFRCPKPHVFSAVYPLNIFLKPWGQQIGNWQKKIRARRDAANHRDLLRLFRI